MVNSLLLQAERPHCSGASWAAWGAWWWMGGAWTWKNGPKLRRGWAPGAPGTAVAPAAYATTGGGASRKATATRVTAPSRPMQGPHVTKVIFHSLLAISVLQCSVIFVIIQNAYSSISNIVVVSWKPNLSIYNLPRVHHHHHKLCCGYVFFLAVLLETHNCRFR